ncbi:NIPSNAP family protein [Halalkalibacter oceani]|uniref:NIPSNAP family protein n=1 Tax=Halalkalibacter oceani TaxID=1653776 RepID=A0A9X2IQ57_9BACI|nr:NIPSNAP family protein [Halalkalibacter oceani]MCM3715925.1 NIPSNAP family protein [Halalkalibacter oceani]
MIYELRIYTMHEGKMQAIHDRFSQATLEIFEKHGMRVTQFWEDIEPENNRIFYVMEFPDMETRNQQFEKFQADPEWQRVKADSEKDGPIVKKLESIFLKNVPYFTGK